MANFRGLEDLSLKMDAKTTILFGVNGVGKSTSLRAIDLLYANMITGIAKTKRLAVLSFDDIMFGKARATIEADFVFSDGESRSYKRTISRSDGRKHNSKELAKLVEHFRNCYIEEDYEDEQGNWIKVQDKLYPRRYR